MLLKKEAVAIISTVTRPRFQAVCPGCQQLFSLSQAGLFVGDHFTPQAAAIHATRREDVITRKAALQERKRKMAPQSEQLAGSVNLGCVLERLAPSMKAFPFH